MHCHALFASIASLFLIALSSGGRPMHRPKDFVILSFPRTGIRIEPHCPTHTIFLEYFYYILYLLLETNTSYCL